jgi:hypothetical protein
MSLAVKNLRLAMAGREAAIAGPPGRFRSFPKLSPKLLPKTRYHDFVINLWRRNKLKDRPN